MEDVKDLAETIDVLALEPTRSLLRNPQTLARILGWREILAIDAWHCRNSSRSSAIIRGRLNERRRTSATSRT